jgi:hypothetical protein
MIRLLEGEGRTGCPVLTVTNDGFAGPQPGSASLNLVERLIRQAGGVLTREDGIGTRGVSHSPLEHPRTLTFVMGGESRTASSGTGGSRDAGRHFGHVVNYADELSTAIPYSSRPR